jgi:hypothetical protein
MSATARLRPAQSVRGVQARQQSIAPTNFPRTTATAVAASSRREDARTPPRVSPRYHRFDRTRSPSSQRIPPVTRGSEQPGGSLRTFGVDEYLTLDERVTRPSVDLERGSGSNRANRGTETRRSNEPGVPAARLQPERYSPRSNPLDLELVARTDVRSRRRDRAGRRSEPFAGRVVVPVHGW